MKNHIFISGASGVVGSVITKLFFEDNQSKISLLIRPAKNPEETDKKIAKLKAFIGCNNSNDRIDIYIGDITEKNFSLKESEYQLLTKHVTHIIHCAGDVKLNQTIDKARKSAVNSLEYIIQLAVACENFTKLDYVSTVGVGGSTYTIVPEEDLTLERTFRNTYEQAKAEAELLLTRKKQPFRWTIHRPSMVVGDSETGKAYRSQVFFYICKFLSGKYTLGFCPPFKSIGLDIIPVDIAAKAIFLSSQNSSTDYKILNLASGKRQVSLNLLQAKVRELYGASGEKLPAIKTIPLVLFSFVYLLPEKSKLRALGYILNYLKTRQMFDNSEFCKFMAEHSINIPDPETYLNKVIA